MSERRSLFVTFGMTVSVSLLASALSMLALSFYYRQLQFDLVNAVCGEVVEQEPAAREIVSAALKEYTRGNADGTAESGLLSSLGYRASDFSGPTYRQSLWCIAAGFLTGGMLFVCTWICRNRREALRIQALAEYLEQACTGSAPILSTSPASLEAAAREDAFSRLEDEIYKTVTSLYQAKEEAVQARNGFAENLSNIAHQIKTPITAISLSVQMAEHTLAESSPFAPESATPPEAEDPWPPAAAHGPSGQRLSAKAPVTSGQKTPAADFLRSHLEQIQKQLKRLTHLEEALLLLSRIDAGTLFLKKEEVDVFTLLVLAKENMQELLAASGTFVVIPEMGSMMIPADLDWTMEAVMNLLKNCMEHGGGGKIHCSYAQNPLYTEILIWDEGQGFAKEDIPYLFKRFYRGQNASQGGMGIGLALSKEIIERQNGTLRARNKPDGGALFEIRFYSH